MDLDLDEEPSVLKSYLYIKRQASDCVVLNKTIGWHPIASLVLVYSLQIVVILLFSCNRDGFFTSVCPTETVKRNHAFLSNFFSTSKFRKTMARAPDALFSMPKANTPERFPVFVFDCCFLKIGGNLGATEDECTCSKPGSS